MKYLIILAVLMTSLGCSDEKIMAELRQPATEGNWIDYAPCTGGAEGVCQGDKPNSVIFDETGDRGALYYVEEAADGGLYPTIYCVKIDSLWSGPSVDSTWRVPRDTVYNSAGDIDHIKFTQWGIHGAGGVVYRWYEIGRNLNIRLDNFEDKSFHNPLTGEITIRFDSGFQAGVFVFVWCWVDKINPDGTLSLVWEGVKV